MSNLLQLNPPLPVWIEGRGNAVAHLVIENGPEHDLQWVCFLDADGECWTVPNPRIRARFNVTLGRPPCPPPAGPEIEPPTGVMP